MEQTTLPSPADRASDSADQLVLPGFFNLLNESISIYKQKWISFLKIAVATLGFIIVSILAGALIMVALKLATVGISNNGAMMFPAIAGMSVLFAIFIYFAVWIAAAEIIVLRDRNENLGLSEILKRAKPYLANYLVVGLIVALIEIFGFIMLIIPGIIFSVWLMSAGFLVVSDNEKGFSAVSKSRELVRGHFWNVLLLVFLGSVFFWTLQMMVSLLPFFDMIINTLVIGPLSLTFSYLIFEHLKQIKGIAGQAASGQTSDVETAAKSHELMKILAALGFIALIIIVGVMIARAPQIINEIQQTPELRQKILNSTHLN